MFLSDFSSRPPLNFRLIASTGSEDIAAFSMSDALAVAKRKTDDQSAVVYRTCDGETFSVPYKVF